MALTEEQLRRLPQPAQTFWRKAFDFVRDHQTDWILIKAGTEQFTAWREYFATKGWEPFAFRQVRLEKIDSIVMPSEWPEWFEGVAPAVEAAE